MANPFDAAQADVTPDTSGNPFDVATQQPKESFLDKVRRIASAPSPEWMRAPEQAIRETVLDQLPHTLQDYLIDLFPPLAASRQGAEIASGNLGAIPGVGSFQAVREAEKTPAYSVPRYKAAIRTLMDLGMLAGLADRPTLQPRAGATAPIEMPGATGFTLGRGELPARYIESAQPSWQPIQPTEPIPFGPQAEPWRQPQYSVSEGGEIFEPTDLWPLSRQIRRQRQAAIEQAIKGEPSAVQEPSAGSVLQQEPQEIGSAGSERGRVEPSLQGIEPAPAQPVQEELPQPPTQAEAPQVAPKRTFKQRPPFDAFGGETTPVSAAIINDIGGIVSKSAARAQGRFEGNADLWDGAPNLSHPTHNKIYDAGGEMPDEAAKDLYASGLIREPTAEAMWEAIDKESRSTRRAAKAQMSIDVQQKEKVQQFRAFDQTQKFQAKAGAPAIPARDLQVGDTVNASGEEFKVTDIDPDTFDVTLEDGTKFGVQTVTDNAVIYGEHTSVPIPLRVSETSSRLRSAPTEESFFDTFVVRKSTSPRVREVARSMLPMSMRERYSLESNVYPTLTEPERAELNEVMNNYRRLTTAGSEGRFPNGESTGLRGQVGAIQTGPTATTEAGSISRVQETPEGELFSTEALPFNLRGEELTEEVGQEGAARAKAQSDAETRKAQGDLFGRAGIERAGEAGGVPRPAPSRVLAPGAVRGSGRYKQVYQINKEAGDKVNALAASRESAGLRAEIQSRKVIGDLTPQEQADLGRYLVSERLKTVNPDHPQILSDAETARISRTPSIARAINRYVREVKPEIEQLRKRAGLTAEAAAGKGREFISLIPATDELLDVAQTPVGNVPLRFRSKTTRFAQRAEGLAKAYETDLPKLLDESYREVTQKARLRDLYETLAKRGLARKEPFDLANGEQAQPLAIGRAAGGELSSALPDVIFTPKAVADAIRDVMERPPDITHPVLKFGKALQRGITGTALTANPAELVNHMRRQLDAVAAVPAANVPAPVRALEAVVPYFGPRLGVAIRTVTEDMSTPANQAILQDIFDAGGGSARAFQEYQAKHIPGVRSLQKATQQLLFGIPKGRGIGGWDLRMRVQLEKIRRAVEGNTDPQRIREFSNQIGQYTSRPDKLIQVVRTVNPYAATTLPLRWTELKQLTGTSGLKAKTAAGQVGLQAETLLRGVGGTLVALTTANYLLSGKWPWQNDPGHELDLNTGIRDKNGKEQYLKLRAIAPTLSRPVQTLSLPELMRERTAGKGKSYIAAGAIGPVNQALSIVNSPLANTALTAATGYAPYFTRVPGRPPSLYDVAASHEKPTPKVKGSGLAASPPPPEGLKAAMSDRGVRQIMAALQGINPIGRAFEEQDLPGPLGWIQRPVPGVEPFGRVFTSSYEHKASTRKKPETLRQQLAREKRKAKQP